MQRLLILPLLLATYLCQAQGRKQGFVVTLNGSTRDTISLSELDTNSTIGLVINDTNGKRIKAFVAGYCIVVNKSKKFYCGHSPKLPAIVIKEIYTLSRGDKFLITQVSYWPDKEKRAPLVHHPMKTIYFR